MSQEDKTPSEKQLYELFNNACDERLSPAELKQFAMLLKDPAVREKYVNYCQMHADLHFRIREERASRQAVNNALFPHLPYDDILPPTLRGGGSNGMSDAPEVNPMSGTNGTSFTDKGPIIQFRVSTILQQCAHWAKTAQVRVATILFILVGVMAIGGAGLAYWNMNSAQSPTFATSETDPLDDEHFQVVAERNPETIACLTMVDHAVWEGELRPSKGTTFTEGQQLRLLKGQAQISMSGGVEVVLKAPCSIVLTEQNQIRLNNGLLNIQVADWANGFTVSTEKVQILDLGTRFTVSVNSSNGTVEAHAIDGDLRVSSANILPEKRLSETVNSGDAIRIKTATNEKTLFKANAELFDSKLDDIRPFKPVKIASTGHGISEGEEDAHWRVVSSSYEGFGKPRYAMVCSNLPRNLANNPKGSQWITAEVNATTFEGNNYPVNTTYTFETQFDLSEYDVKTVTLVAQAMADNGVLAVRLNGKPVAFKPWILNNKYQVFNTFNKIEFKEGFVRGINTIQFDVWNGFALSSKTHEKPNPIGLRVEWEAFGRQLIDKTEMRVSIPSFIKDKNISVPACFCSVGQKHKE